MIYANINETMLSFDIGWHCWLKRSLKILAFSRKLTTSFQFTTNKLINKTFTPLTKALSFDQ